MVATIGVSGLNFLFHVLISLLLGPSHYGALNAVLNVISVLAVPLGAVQLAVTQAVAPGQGKDGISLRRLTLKATLWGAWAMAAVWLLSPLIDGFLNLQSPVADLTIGCLDPPRGRRGCPAGRAARRAALRARRRRHVLRRRCAAAGQRCLARRRWASGWKAPWRRR